MPLSLRAYSDADRDSVMAFVAAHPWGFAWSESLVHRFLTGLVSSPTLVFDFFDGGERAAVVVLIDKIENTVNDASLEVLALRAGVDPEELFAVLLPEAKKRLPANRSGITVSFASAFTAAEAVAARHALLPHYEMYEMVNRAPSAHAALHAGEFVEGTPADEADLYQALKIAFRENPDTNISGFEEWSSTRARNMERKTWLKRVDGKVAAFLHLFYPGGEMEISTVGVLPEYRGQGLAQRLIAHVLAEIPALGGQECKLSVAVQNKRALGLYTGLGFEVTDHHLVFRWARPRA